MSSNDTEQAIMQMIIYAGDAKSCAMEAVQLARKNMADESKDKLSAAEASLCKAHEVQTQLLTCEAQGQEPVKSLLMNHAQDHLMGAITSLDLAKEIVYLWDFVRAQKQPS